MGAVPSTGFSACLVEVSRIMAQVIGIIQLLAGERRTLRTTQFTQMPVCSGWRSPTGTRSDKPGCQFLVACLPNAFLHGIQAGRSLGSDPLVPLSFPSGPQNSEGSSQALWRFKVMVSSWHNFSSLFLSNTVSTWESRVSKVCLMHSCEDKEWVWWKHRDKRSFQEKCSK